MLDDSHGAIFDRKRYWLIPNIRLDGVLGLAISLGAARLGERNFERQLSHQQSEGF